PSFLFFPYTTLFRSLHTSSCTAPSLAQSCSQPSEHVPPRYSLAVLASEQARQRLSVSESRNIHPLSQRSSLSSVSQLAGRTSYSETTETRRLSFLLRQTSCARPPLHQSCLSL